MIKRTEAPVAVREAQSLTATPTYSTDTNPASIFFSGHPHTLTITGEQLEAAAAKAVGEVTIFPVGGSHPHNLKLTSDQAKALIKDGVVKSTADLGHTHVVTFKRQANGDAVALMQPMAPSVPVRRMLAPAFPSQGIPIADPLHYFVRSSVDGQYMGRGFRSGEVRKLIISDVGTGSKFTFDFGAYDPAFAKEFVYFQGFDEAKNEMCFVVPMRFCAEQAASGKVDKSYSLEWFQKNAPDMLIRIPGILVYQDLPTSGHFAVQCTGQVWDEGVKVPTDTAYIPKTGSFPPAGEIWLTPLATPTTAFKVEVGEVGNAALNDIGDRIVAQRVVGEGASARCEFVVYEVRGEVTAGAAAPTLHEIYKLPAEADKADMLGHRWLTFERRAGPDRSELVLHDMQKGKDHVIKAAKADCVLKFPHFVALPEGGVIEVRYVEQQWIKDSAGAYTGVTNVYRSLRIV